jgi:hypothetical protein
MRCLSRQLLGHHTAKVASRHLIKAKVSNARFSWRRVAAAAATALLKGDATLKNIRSFRVGLRIHHWNSGYGGHRA